MRTLGILGGMSWESTAEYYRLINRGTAERLGGLHSARLLMHSVDFADVAALQRAGDWKAAGTLLGEAASQLEQIGAAAIVLATNTMHQVAGDIEAAITVPLIHIVDPTGDALARHGVRRAGLLGTRYTMELPFWRERLRERYGIDLVVPDEANRALVHRVIFDELCLGRIDADSRAQYVAVTKRLRDSGAEAVIFGCTEIGLLLKPEHVSLPAFDTTALHAAAAVSFSLGGEENGRPDTEPCMQCDARVRRDTLHLEPISLPRRHQVQSRHQIHTDQESREQPAHDYERERLLRVGAHATRQRRRQQA